jgi:AraC-like DNA-binding protein
MLTANLVLMFLVLFLLFKNHFENNKGILYIIIAAFCFYIRLLSDVFPLSAFEDYPPLLYLILNHSLIGFLVPPLIILYFHSVFNKSYRINPIYYLFFGPFLFFGINFIPYWGLSLSDKIQLYNNPNSILEVKYYLLISWKVFNVISDFYNSILGTVIIFFIFRNFTSSKSPINKKTFSSLIQLWVILGLDLIILFSLRFPKYLNLNEFISSDIREILVLIVPLSVLLFPDFLFNNSNKSDLKFYLRLVKNFTENGDKTANLDEDIISDSAKILNYLHKDKAYLSPGFSRHDIVTHLDIPQKTVTDCFNKVIKIPFPKLRNQLRIEHATELFKNNAHLTKTISGIAIDSGFQNRASFYIAFKEVMKMTPIEWIKENCEFELVEELEVDTGEGSESTVSTQSTA